MKTLQEVAKDALALQDAVNASGILYSVPDYLEVLGGEVRRLGESTDWRNKHPVLVIIYSKLADLATFSLEPPSKLSLAFEACRIIASGVEKFPVHDETEREYFNSYCWRE